TGPLPVVAVQESAELGLGNRRPPPAVIAPERTFGMEHVAVLVSEPCERGTGYLDIRACLELGPIVEHVDRDTPRCLCIRPLDFLGDPPAVLLGDPTRVRLEQGCCCAGARAVLPQARDHEIESLAAVVLRSGTLHDEAAELGRQSVQG